jgi:iron complex transport system substrate-binding protein
VHPSAAHRTLVSVHCGALLCALVAVIACRADGREGSRDTSASAARGAGAAAKAAALRTDDFGDTVPSRLAARRIVSLSPTTTELLFALGVGDRVVGRTRWDSYPDSARLVPDLGDGLRPNVEAVLAARPDLVVLYASADNRAAASTLRGAGVATLSLRVDRVEEFRRAARLLGALTGAEARARAVVDSVDATLARVRAATAGRPRPTVFWHVWDAPLITIGRGSFMTELVETAGGKNVFGDLPDPSPQVAFEELLRRDPDVVLAGPEGVARLRADASWRRTRAVRAGRLLVVDTALVGRPGVRLGEAAVSLARLLHPGALP